MTEEDDALHELLGSLAPKSARKVDERLGLASDAATAPAVLAELARAPDVNVRRAVASNPNVSPETLVVLSAEFPEEFFGNPALALYLLENPGLFSEMPEETLAKLVAHPSMPAGLIILAVRHRAFYVRRAAAQNPRLPPALLVELAEQQSYFEEVAGNPSTPPDYLAKLARHDWVAVRRAAVRNPSLPESALAALANDGDAKVRKAAVRHPSATETVLAELAKHESPLVRLAVAECETTPARVLANLEKDADASVRFFAARPRSRTKR